MDSYFSKHVCYPIPFNKLEVGVDNRLAIASRDVTISPDMLY